MKERKTDRYVTFKGIDGEGNSRRLLELLRKYIDDPATSNPFWEKFKTGLNRAGDASSGSGNRRDELLLVHSYINNIRELFEAHDDGEALGLLQQVEEESC
jgi:hypothetical protein